jgi:hypothetical protein
VDDFGETLVGKKRPTIFVFNIKENTLNEVHGIPKGTYPAFPIFDQDSKGIVFSGIQMPVQKLGLSYCLNRPTPLFYLADPQFEKPKEG